MLKAAHYWKLLIKTTTTTHSLAWLKLKALTVNGDRDVEQQELSLKHAHTHAVYISFIYNCQKSEAPKMSSFLNLFF